jgi:peptidoglycan/LPS O-acetylase OafA/YrhL
MTPPTTTDLPPLDYPPPNGAGARRGNGQRGAWATALVDDRVAPTIRSPEPEPDLDLDLDALPPPPAKRPAPAAADHPPPAAPRLPHLRALDGLRGLAVLAVVFYHWAPGVAPGGFLGVDLFFVLSGFLITSLLVSERESTGDISLGRFWGRRARRLLPALFLVLAAVGVYVLVTATRVDAQHVANDGLAAFAYVANWHFISSGQPYFQQFIQQAPSPLRHTWSLAIEEQFYLIWPLVVLLVARVATGHAQRRGRQRRRLRHALFGVCLVLGALSFLRMLTLFHGGDPNRVYYGTDSRAFIILVGAALGALTVGRPFVATRWLRGLLVLVGCGAIGVLVYTMATLNTTSSWLYNGGYGIVAVLMVVVLAAAAQRFWNPLGRLLSVRPLVGLGLISYGVYLWHWPIALWITPSGTGLDGPALFLLRAVVTLAVSLASYYLVEQPIRQGRLPGLRLKNRGIVPMLLVTVVALVLLIPAVAYPSVAAAPTAGSSTSEAAAVTAAYERAPRCDGGHASRTLGPGRVRVQLVGNSIAQEVRACVGTILSSRGAALEGLSPPGFLMCEILPQVQQEVTNKATRPSAGVLFALVAASADPACGAHSTWQTPVRRLIRMWKSVGAHIYLVPSVPAAAGSTVAQQRILARSVSSAVKVETAYYHQLASADPTHITLVDAGVFLHDDRGRYPWQMPCLRGEPGCTPRQTVGVRWINDGFHFCYTVGAFKLDQCPVAEAAGERRAAAGIATGIVTSLEALVAAGSVR